MKGPTRSPNNNDNSYTLDVELLTRAMDFIREERDNQTLSQASDQVSVANQGVMDPQLLKNGTTLNFRGSGYIAWRGTIE